MNNSEQKAQLKGFLVLRAIEIAIVAGVLALIVRIWFGDSVALVAFWVIAGLLAMMIPVFRQMAFWFIKVGLGLILALWFVSWLIEMGN